MDLQARLDMDMATRSAKGHIDEMHTAISDGALSIAWEQLVAARRQLDVVERRMKETGIIPASTTPG